MGSLGNARTETLRAYTRPKIGKIISGLPEGLCFLQVLEIGYLGI